MAHGEPIRKRTGGGPGPSGAVGSPIPASPQIPDKLYFRIGEVARLCGVPAYVLRFWESEFPQLKPNKGGTGQRLYRRRDVEMALRIKSLLYDQGFTIPGARQAFKTELRTGKDPQLGLGGIAETHLAVAPKQLLALRKELEDLVTLLSNPAAAKSERRAVQPIRRAFSQLRLEKRNSEVASHFVPRPQLLQRLTPAVLNGLFDTLPSNEG